MRVRTKGPWSAARIDEHLDQSRIPLRLAWLAPSGFPWVTSLWYVRREGALWCASVSDAAIVRGLRRDARCGFEVASELPPYCGVRGRGRAELVPARGEEILRALVARYLGGEGGPLARWLLSRAEREVAIRIEPDQLASWDYRERMARG
jgi:nitroimidazol reductase NimA-like FMN-containing flavoprotein (pyridoxamine 5'-phosphate oxidase superfamily)